MLMNLLLKTPLLGILLGPLVTYLGDAVHRLWPWLDKQPAITKQACAVVLSFILVGLVQLVPGAIPPECANVAATGISSTCEAALSSGPFLQAVVSAIVAVAVKHGQQNDAAKP